MQVIITEAGEFIFGEPWNSTNSIESLRMQMEMSYATE